MRGIEEMTDTDTEKLALGRFRDCDGRFPIQPRNSMCLLCTALHSKGISESYWHVFLREQF